MGSGKDLFGNILGYRSTIEEFLERGSGLVILEEEHTKLWQDLRTQFFSKCSSVGRSSGFSGHPTQQSLKCQMKVGTALHGRKKGRTKRIFSHFQHQKKRSFIHDPNITSMGLIGGQRRRVFVLLKSLPKHAGSIKGITDPIVFVGILLHSNEESVTHEQANDVNVHGIAFQKRTQDILTSRNAALGGKIGDGRKSSHLLHVLTRESAKILIAQPSEGHGGISAQHDFRG
mmetsp:Transcript_3215/g.5841  ORF Transcript_3215/g.5841 Transcript_3215/m.5841 type:complete len:230 (-) Transcript_3215:370-1059(-)